MSYSLLNYLDDMSSANKFNEKDVMWIIVNQDWKFGSVSHMRLVRNVPSKMNELLSERSPVKFLVQGPEFLVDKLASRSCRVWLDKFQMRTCLVKYDDELGGEVMTINAVNYSLSN